MFCQKLLKVYFHQLISVRPSKLIVSKDRVGSKSFLFTSCNSNKQSIVAVSLITQKGIRNVRYPFSISNRIYSDQRKLTGITDKKIPQSHTIHVNEALVLESIPINRILKKPSQKLNQSFLNDVVLVMFSGSPKDSKVSGPVQLGKISIANYDEFSPQDVSLVPVTIYEHCNCFNSIFSTTCKRIDDEFNNCEERSYELNVLAVPEGDQISINQECTSFHSFNGNGISIKGLKFNVKIHLPNVEQDIEDYINEKKGEGSLKDFNNIDGIRMEFVATVSGITGIQLNSFNAFSTNQKHLNEFFTKVLTNLVKECIQNQLNNENVE